MFGCGVVVFKWGWIGCYGVGVCMFDDVVKVGNLFIFDNYVKDRCNCFILIRMKDRWYGRGMLI